MEVPDPNNNWYVVGLSIGAVIAGATWGFQKLYYSARNDERVRAERTPETTVNAVGAAFVDRSAADAIVRIGDNVHQILEIMEDKAVQEKDDRTERQIEKRIIEKLGAKKPDV